MLRSLKQVCVVVSGIGLVILAAHGAALGQAFPVAGTSPPGLPGDRADRPVTEQAVQQPLAGLRSADLGLWFGVPTGGALGLPVADVANPSVFAQAGIREGDAIMAINGQPVTTETQLVELLTSPALANQAASITFVRNGHQQTFTVQPSAIVQGAATFDPLYQFGMLVDERIPNRFVVERVFPRTPAFYAGLRAGDIITSANGTPIQSLDGFTRILRGAPGQTDLVVTRNGQVRQLNFGTFGSTASTAVSPDFGTSGVATSGPRQGLTTAAPIAPASPAALGTPPTPSLSVQPGRAGAVIAVPGVRTAVPGAPTAVPGARTAVPGAPTAVPSRQGVGNPVIRGGTNPNAPAAVPATGGIGGAGSSAGQGGRVGGTGAIGGAGSTAGSTGPTTGATGTRTPAGTGAAVVPR